MRVRVHYGPEGRRPACANPGRGLAQVTDRRRVTCSRCRETLLFRLGRFSPDPIRYTRTPPAWDGSP